MAKVISIINLKGGVGKTTITVALAEFLAMERQKRVLVIDLDPQTNSTVALIGDKMWQQRNERGQTLYHLFKDHLDDTAEFDMDRSLVRRASNLNGGLPNLHLLPSSLDFVRIQDRLIQIWQTAMIRPHEVLRHAITPYLEQYDLVLIDCPPNLGIVTQNGLAISDWYLIPAIPDHLSTYGIKQIRASMYNFNRRRPPGEEVRMLGVVASMYRSTVALHKQTIEYLEKLAREGKLSRLFQTKIPLTTRAAEASDFDTVGLNTLKQKYGGSGLYDDFRLLTEEFLRYVEEK